jgi:hypothetical protein
MYWQMVSPLEEGPIPGFNVKTFYHRPKRGDRRQWKAQSREGRTVENLVTMSVSCIAIFREVEPKVQKCKPFESTKSGKKPITYEMSLRSGTG